MLKPFRGLEIIGGSNWLSMLEDDKENLTNNLTVRLLRAGIYLFKVNNNDTRSTPLHNRSGVSSVDFEQVNANRF